MEGTILGIAVGLSLAAATGFRVFVPMLVLSLASRAQWVELSGDMAWLGSNAALLILAVATVAEILAFYVPWLDNFLDTLATPAALVAGALVSASVLPDLHPALRWSVAVVGGSGLASVFQGATAGTRVVSSVSTGGMANFLVATFETFVAVVLAVLAVVVPLLALLVLAVLLWLAITRLLVLRQGPAGSPVP